MKKLLTALCFTCTFYSQSCNNAPAGKNDVAVEDLTKSSSGKVNLNRISVSEVPSKVMSTFKSKYPAATEVEWQTATENNQPSYKAKWFENGVKRKVEFSVDGRVLKEK